MSESKKEAAQAKIEMSALAPGFRRVKSVISAAANSGTSKIRRARISIILEFHRREVLDMSCLAFAVKRNNQSKTNSHFGGRDSDNKENHHLAVEIVVEARHRNKSEVGRVQ